MTYNIILSFKIHIKLFIILAKHLSRCPTTIKTFLRIFICRSTILLSTACLDNCNAWPKLLWLVIRSNYRRKSRLRMSQHATVVTDSTPVVTNFTTNQKAFKSIPMLKQLAVISLLARLYDKGRIQANIHSHTQPIELASNFHGDAKRPQINEDRANVNIDFLLLFR